MEFGYDPLEPTRISDDPLDFPALAVQSASIYLSYLDASKNFAGRKITSVFHIQPTNLPSDFNLTISDRLRDTDSCQIWIDGQVADKISVLKYTSRNRVHQIRIRVDDPNIDFLSLLPEDIKIISDMRFLVSRLRDFYSSCKIDFEPPHPIKTAPLPDNLLEGLSEEQLAAVEGIATSPISYVGGAPGTGKTRAVLSRAIMRYVFSGKRVLLLAPTNNAVEQMLYGVLPVMSDAGINLTSVYRIGPSSEEFAFRYPEVAGDANADAMLENLNNQLSEKKQALAICQEHIAKYHKEKFRQSTCIKMHEQVSRSLPKIISYNAEISDLSTQLKAAQEIHAACQSDFEALKKAVADSEISIHACEKLLQDNTSQANSLSYILFKRRERKALLDVNVGLVSELTSKRISHTILLEKQNIANDKLSAALAKMEDISASQKQALASRMTEQNTVLSATRIEPEYHQHIQALLNDCLLHSGDLDKFMSDLDTSVRMLKETAESNSIEEIQTSIDEIKEKIATIGKTAKQQQKEAALVLAGTIDGSLNYLKPQSVSEPGKEISHIFLDEAGYTSIIRGMTVFCSNAPVTFLGDHKQLPPVCEMNDIKPENAAACLWALSVAYYTELLNGSLSDLYINCYCAANDPSFDNIQYFPLTKSYRFGPLLANILARHVYNSRFQGLDKGSFEILVLNANHEPGPFNRSSLSEAMAINRHISKFDPDNIAILAPYNNQIKLLQQILPRRYRTSIMTVHRSQGKEWETVILSVTDTNNRYFTDSRLAMGKRIINTAISRAKRRLIIVCDTDVWGKYPDQMVTDLIRCGRLIESIDC